MIGAIIVGLVVIVVCTCVFGSLMVDRQDERVDGTWTLPDVLSSLVLSTKNYVSPGESRGTLENRKAEIKKMMKILKKCEQVDLCFLVDCTGSMQSWIDSVKKGIKNLSESLYATYKDCDLRVAFVGYTDFDQPELIRINQLDFTNSVEDFKEFVDEIRAHGGGDCAEDVMGALKTVTKLSWRNGLLTKVLIHIADAPCHGKEYHGDSVGDDHPKGDPEGISHWTMMNELVRLDVQYWFGHIQKENTRKMVEVFNQSLMQLSQRVMTINEFEALNPEKVAEAVFDSVCSSIATTATLKGRRRRSIREYKLDRSPPDMNKIEKVHSARRLEPIAEEEEDVPKDDGVSASELPAGPVRFKVNEHPFGKGTSLLVYHAWDEDQRMKIVLKQSLTHESDTKEYYEGLVHVQHIAKKFGKQFNKERPSYTPTIEFQEAKVVEIPTSTGDIKYYLSEPLLSGKYEKFNTNGGWVTPEKSVFSQTIQAFSHFTWVISKKQLLICDLQGVKMESENRLILTDPAIHHRNQLMKYGGTNLGAPGIQNFFKTHVCNDVCNRMKLEPYTRK